MLFGEARKVYGMIVLLFDCLAVVSAARETGMSDYSLLDQNGYRG
jgi:hypothetical protein